MRPDEYRQRFTALAGLTHIHLAGTLEVLEIGGRPAVLQEWLTGLASSDWPALAAAPGVWFRLVSQAALALQTAHTAGLVHGALEAQDFVFTSDGVLKLKGLGEPRWLLQPAAADDREPSVASDLHQLGQIAAAWAALARARAASPRRCRSPCRNCWTDSAPNGTPASPAPRKCWKRWTPPAPRCRPTRRPGNASDARCASCRAAWRHVNRPEHN